MEQVPCEGPTRTLAERRRPSGAATRGCIDDEAARPRGGCIEDKEPNRAAKMPRLVADVRDDARRDPFVHDGRAGGCCLVVARWAGEPGILCVALTTRFLPPSRASRFRPHGEASSHPEMPIRRGLNTKARRHEEGMCRENRTLSVLRVFVSSCDLRFSGREPDLRRSWPQREACRSGR